MPAWGELKLLSVAVIGLAEAGRLDRLEQSDLVKEDHWSNSSADGFGARPDAKLKGPWPNANVSKLCKGKSLMDYEKTYCLWQQGDKVTRKPPNPLALNQHCNLYTMGIDDISLQMNDHLLSKAIFSYKYVIKNTEPIEVWLKDKTGDVYSKCMRTTETHEVVFSSDKPELVEINAQLLK
eukprot:gb/GFBE01035345.1/.p1 GENE.gb/GFBE01035345.1/~~gb/GFBE01035345.1/.p1  ORF type:complete len:180 (+),score=26.53 gb/GFBE01035345.1/:1-540(+)